MAAYGNIPETANGHKATAKRGSEYHRTRLDVRIAKFNALVVKVYCYLDSLQFANPWTYIKHAEQMALKDLAYDAVFPRSMFPRDGLDRRTMLIHQPSPEAVHYIEKHFPDHQVTRADPAFDWHTRSREDADAAYQLLMPVLMMKWHNQREMNLFKGTLYFAASDERRNQVAYVPRRGTGKIADGPNVHLDLRYLTAAVCKTHGFTTAADAFDWELSKYLHRDACLAVIDWHKAEPLVAAQARAQQADHVRRQRTVDLGSGIRRFKRLFCAAISGGGPIPQWGEDLENFGVQRLVDRLPILRSALVKRPLADIINIHKPNPTLYLIATERSFLQRQKRYFPPVSNTIEADITLMPPHNPQPISSPTSIPVTAEYHIPASAPQWPKADRVHESNRLLHLPQGHCPDRRPDR